MSPMLIADLPARFPRSWTRAIRVQAAGLLQTHLQADWVRFRTMNPAHAERAYVMARRVNGRFILYLKHTDPFTGGSCTDSVSFGPTQEELASKK
jgi:hypothetical protein